MLPVDPMTAAGLAGLVLLAVGGGVIFMRRRSSAPSIDDDPESETDDFGFGSESDLPASVASNLPASAASMENEDDARSDDSPDIVFAGESAPAPAPAEASDDSDLPAFSGFDADPNEETVLEPALRDAPAATGAPETQDSTPLAGPASGGLFDEDDEKGETEMEQMSTGVGAETPTMASFGAADSDVARLVSELQNRLNQVETRLEETHQTCERLERQVAAQSEELRVQRAAIARTQRALRSLSRTEEEQATEPALRDPS